MAEDHLKHVSDTALLVAACRALETDREDGVIRDPFAGLLAGERGMAFARTVPMLDWMGFGVGVRARTFDELMLNTIPSRKIETVVNLGAGLDTRPWRLDLPAQLRWIEADFPAMLEYKAAKLEGEKPACRWEQVATDLANAEDRRNLYARIGEAPALMITEGVLMYLPRQALEGIASESPRLSGVRAWLLDVASETLMGVESGGGHSTVKSLRPESHLEGEAILDAVAERGWTIAIRQTYLGAGATAPPARIAAIVAEFKKDKPDFEAPSDDVSGMYLLLWPDS